MILAMTMPALLPQLLLLTKVNMDYPPYAYNNLLLIKSNACFFLKVLPLDTKSFFPSNDDAARQRADTDSYSDDGR